MEANSTIKVGNSFQHGGGQVKEQILIPVRVVDIILDINHEEAKKHGGYDAIGTIFYAEVNIKEGESLPKILRTAKPMFQFIKQYPLKNEIVSLISSPGTSIYDVSEEAATYYLPNFNIWNHPHHNALPDMRYFKEGGNQVDDYEMVNGGLVRTAKDKSTEISLGDYFHEKLNTQPLLPFEGDTIIEGRFGSSIRFGGMSSGSREKTAYSTAGNVGDPIIIFRNGAEVEENDRGWEHTVENINTDHSSFYLCSNQKFTNFVAASTNWESWNAKHDELDINEKAREEFDNLTVGPTPQKIIVPELPPAVVFEHVEYEDDYPEELATEEGMCTTCEPDELSIYDELMNQENFSPDDFNWLEYEHVFEEETGEEVRTEVDHIAGQDGNTGDGGFDNVDYSNVPGASGDEATKIKEAMSLLQNTHGASKHGAAAIVGNMLAESRLIVDRLETSWLNKKESYKGGIGLVQWTGSRRLKFEKYFGICNSIEERKQLIGTNNSTVASYQGKVRQKASFSACVKYYWDEIGSSIQSKMKNATTAEAAADAILADLRPGAYLCWRDWPDKTYCNKGQTTEALALAGKNKTRNKRVKNSMKAYNTV